MFSDLVVGNKDYFFTVMLAPGTIVLDVTTEGKKVGVMYITDVRPRMSADAHYFFWDRRTKGRQKVILAGLDWGMREFGLHRVNVLIPKFAYSALHRVLRMGLRIEGRKREALLSQNKWVDILVFGILRQELDGEALQTGVLRRTSAEQSWFSLLNEDEELMSHVVNRRAK